MKLLPEIREEVREDAEVRFGLWVGAEFVHFSGHFPGQPILPGVVQLDWAVRLGERHFPLPRGAFSQLKALKFTSPVLPDTELTLLLRWHAERQRLDFSYHAGERPCSSGQIVFGAQA